MTTQSYKISKIRQLVDLNSDITNFEAKFQVVSKNGEPFKMVIANQTLLDNNKELDYKDVTDGKISGSIVQNDNNYQNFFIALKADKECICDVTIDRKEIEPAKQVVVEPVKISTPTESTTSWLKIGLIILVIAGLAYGAYWYSKKENKPSKPKNLKFVRSSSSSWGKSPPVKANPLDRLKSLNI